MAEIVTRSADQRSLRPDDPAGGRFDAGTIDELAATLVSRAGGVHRRPLRARLRAEARARWTRCARLIAGLSRSRHRGRHPPARQGVCNATWCPPSPTTPPGSWPAGSGQPRGVVAHTRVVAGSPPNRCASHTGMIATRVSAAATTLMTGAWLGRNRFPKIQIGKRLHRRPRGERRHHDLVEAQGERQDRARDQCAAHHRERHVRNVCHGDAPRSAEASSRLVPSLAAGPGCC